MAIAVEHKDKVTVIMNEIVAAMRFVFGDALRQVILFGSYARGEQEEYSDLDIMVLVNIPDNELKQYNNAIAEVMTDVSIRHGILPSIIDKNYEHFYQWAPVLPFYRNVQTEGVAFYGS